MPDTNLEPRDDLERAVFAVSAIRNISARLDEAERSAVSRRLVELVRALDPDAATAPTWLQ